MIHTVNKIFFSRKKNFSFLTILKKVNVKVTAASIKKNSAQKYLRKLLISKHYTVLALHKAANVFLTCCVVHSVCI